MILVQAEERTTSRLRSLDRQMQLVTTICGRDKPHGTRFIPVKALCYVYEIKRKLGLSLSSLRKHVQNDLIFVCLVVDKPRQQQAEDGTSIGGSRFPVVVVLLVRQTARGGGGGGGGMPSERGPIRLGE